MKLSLLYSAVNHLNMQRTSVIENIVPKKSYLGILWSFWQREYGNAHPPKKKRSELS